MDSGDGQYAVSGLQGHVRRQFDVVADLAAVAPAEAAAAAAVAAP